MGRGRLVAKLRALNSMFSDSLAFWYNNSSYNYSRHTETYLILMSRVFQKGIGLSRRRLGLARFMKFLMITRNRYMHSARRGIDTCSCDCCFGRLLIRHFCHGNNRGASGNATGMVTHCRSQEILRSRSTENLARKVKLLS